MSPSEENICSEQVFERLFMEFSQRLHNYLYYKSSNAQLAEDLTQEAFLRVWKKCKQVPYAKAKSFLFTVANNLFLDEIKHRKVSLKFTLTQSQTSGSAKDGQFLLEEKEFNQRLEKAIADLPEKQRVVFLMNRIEKMKYREIALLLDISEKAVEKRMSQALKVLRSLHKKI